jgi:hypothetical protein
MSLTYRGGFFPFPILNETTVAAVFPAQNPFAYRVGGIALSALTQLWWLAKSYDYSCAMSGSNFSSGHKVADFSLTGSGTVRLQDLSAGVTSPPFPAWPSARVIYRNTPFFGDGNLPRVGYPTDGAFYDSTGALQTTPVLNGSGTRYAIGDYPEESFTSSPPLQQTTTLEDGTMQSANTWQWFDQMAVSTDGAGNFYTRISFTLTLVYLEFGVLTTFAVPPTSPTLLDWATGASLVLQMNGAPLATVPLYYQSNVGTAPSATISGELTLNFNQFYTP